MRKVTELTSPHKNFEDIKKNNEQGVEYWEARELMPLLGYDKWSNFKAVVIKAIRSCKNSSQLIQHHFTDVGKMIKIAKGTAKEAPRKIQDYHLSRYACYLIAQNGDPRKEQIAIAQTYFAIQTRKQELMQQEQQFEGRKRLMIRKEVQKQNIKLFGTAKKVGVENFGLFNEYGYYGLYGMPLRDIKKKKGIGKESVLDRAGST